MKKFMAFIIVLIIMLNSLLISYSDTLVDLNTNNITNKIDERIFTIAKSQELIPVYVWYKDINQSEVEKLVEEKIGFGKEDISSDIPNISEEDIGETFDLYENNEAEIDTTNLSNYFENNKNLITQEREKTKAYISERRKVAKEMYLNIAEKIVADTNISSSIEFASKYAPMFIAELTLDEIQYLAKNDTIVSIDYMDESLEIELCSEDRYDFDTYITYSRIGEIHDDIGLTGEGTIVGMVEPETFETHDQLPSPRCIKLGTEFYHSGHATNTARIMCGTKGVAPNANLYSVGIDGDIANYGGNSILSFYACIESLIDVGCQIINCSFSYVTITDSYHVVDQWVDHIASIHGVNFVVSAGNISDYNSSGVVTSPGKAYNVITVGACNNNNTIDTSDDTMDWYSCFDELGGCQKPEVVAGANIGGSGTSSSAPVVSGIIALILELRPSLATQPEVIKAIIMASCHDKAIRYGTDDQETMVDGLTSKQGAGVVNAYLAISIVANGNYGYGTIEENTKEYIKFNQSLYDASGINVSISWLRNVTETEGTEHSFDYTPVNNLDLRLYKNGVLDGTSNNINSSAEMIYSPINALTRSFDSEIEYELEIEYVNDDTDNSAETVKYGYAWSSDTDCYNDFEEHEGLYCVKNVATGKYLTYNCEDNTMELADYEGYYFDEFEQLFLISHNQGDEYRLGSAFALFNQGVGINGNIVTHTSVPANIEISRTEDGYYVFKANSMYLSSLNTFSWKAKPYTSLYECWILEKVNYRVGDNDMSGVINETDYNYLEAYCTGAYTPTNADWFLSDTNYDNVLNSDDFNFYSAIIE